jgi:zinc protease
LDNGLKILVQELHTAPLVSVWCWYRVGSGDELPGHTGVSHWVEHMNFKGTENIPRDEMKGIVERFGGTWNGYTWIDQTTYLETAGTDALDTLLFIEAERMAHGLYEPEDCESERTVIISELQGGENDPDQLLDTEVTATAFRAHAYRHPTIGWIDDLRSMTPRRSLRALPAHYVPGNATLVVAGDVDTDDVLRRAEQHFGRSPAAPPPRRAPRAAADRRAARLLEREGTTAYLKFAWHAPAATDGLLSDAGARRRADRRQGREHLVEFPRRAAAAPRAAVHALVERGLASVVAGRCCRRASRSSTTCR